MSSTLGSAQTEEGLQRSSKKRKHDGDSKESKKKKKQRRQLDEPAKLTSTSDKKEKKQKRDRKREQVAVVAGNAESGLVLGLNGNADEVSESKKDRKQKKTREMDEAESDSDAVDQEGLRVAESQKESLSLDALAEGSVTKSMSTSKEEKRKKKKTKPEASVEPETAVQAMEGDIELPDAPPIEQEDERLVEETTLQSQQLESDAATSFYSTRLSLYLPIPPVGLGNSISSVLSLHLAPLLLTYFPPAAGIILSYHDPVLSAKPEAGLNKPLLSPSSGDTPSSGLDETFMKVGEEFGACWVWLTVTFLVLKPETGDELQGWTNVMSEGFIGVVCYNYFQAAVSKNRIPKSWTWSGASREGYRQRKTPRKGRLNDSAEPSQESVAGSQETVVAREDDAMDGGAGTFLDQFGSKIPETINIRVADLEVVPAADRGKWSLQIEGTLLNGEEEAEVREDERQRYENRTGKRKSRSRTGTPLMSGGLPTHSRAESVVSTP